MALPCRLGNGKICDHASVCGKKCAAGHTNNGTCGTDWTVGGKPQGFDTAAPVEEPANVA